RTAVAFFQPRLDGNDIEGITMRVKEGVNPRRFLDDLSTQLSEYKIGNIYLSEPELMTDRRAKSMDYIDKELTQNWVMVIFFLVNVILGIAGTFYIQCRSRIADAGVMRAFGASRCRIEWSIIGEAFITVFLAWLVGSSIYFIYLHSSDSVISAEVTKVTQIIRPMWYDAAATRYSIIGGCVLLLLMISAIIGVWLPARRVGRVPIVDSLRDE
ncbi:MAG: ABC transporter permease, partial [Muribaculaceae bacterium]|nr:ABC transporter permease [Muribaculaceae bacterium]